MARIMVPDLLITLPFTLTVCPGLTSFISTKAVFTVPADVRFFGAMHTLSCLDTGSKQIRSGALGFADARSEVNVTQPGCA